MIIILIIVITKIMIQKINNSKTSNNDYIKKFSSDNSDKGYG